MNFLEFTERFPEERDVINYYIKIRYGGKTICNHCGSEKVSHRTDRLKFFQCNSCNNSFSIFKDTIFEKTTTDLRKWMYAIHLLLNGKKGTSGLQLQREIGVTYKTAWRMLRQIRIAMSNIKDGKTFEAIVEIDETYIGGKPRKKNRKDDDDQERNKRGRGTKKNPVVGIVDRGKKKVYAKVSLPNEEGKKLSGNQLLAILNEVCKSKTTVISDEFAGYSLLKRTEHIHLVIDDTERFVEDFIHTNNVESFWAILKRGVYGIYHQVSVKYLQNYVNEFCFRFNNRDNGDMFDLVLRQGII